MKLRASRPASRDPQRIGGPGYRSPRSGPGECNARLRASGRTGVGGTGMNSGTPGWLGGRRYRIGYKKETAMTTAATVETMPVLAQPGQKVRWRNPGEARACGWEAIFGPGPFVVVRTVDHSGHRRATGLVLRTALGEQEISEVRLALADKPGGDCGGGGVTPVPSAVCAPALPQGR